MTAVALNNLAVWPVLLPLLAAPLAVLLNRARASWLLAVLASGACCAASLWLLWVVRDQGPVQYLLGGWPPPFGIEYRIDELNGLVMLVVSTLGFLCLCYSGRASKDEVEPHHQAVFHALFLLALTGLMGIAATADAFNVFVFLEISSLATYGLVAAGPGRRAVLASLQYLILGTLGGSFLLIGVGLFYQLTGTLNMADLAALLPEAGRPRLMLAAVAFTVLGLGLKSALFPLHQWLPNVYAQAPVAVSAFLAGAATKVAIYALARLAIGVVGIGWWLAGGGAVLQGLAIAGMLYGSVMAMQQQSLRRILAWSSIAQIGYLVYGIALCTAAGISASLIHIANHAVIKGALFMVAGAVLLRGGETLDDLHGLAARMPATFALLVLAGLGLMGVPLTAGFVSKWYLLGAAVEAQAWAGLVAMVISSVLAFVYVGRILEAAYRAPDTAVERSEAPALMLAPAWALGLLILVLGVYSSPLVETANLAAQRLLGPLP